MNRIKYIINNTNSFHFGSELLEDKKRIYFIECVLENSYKFSVAGESVEDVINQAWRKYINHKSKMWFEIFLEPLGIDDYNLVGLSSIFTEEEINRLIKLMNEINIIDHDSIKEGIEDRQIFYGTLLLCEPLNNKLEWKISSDYLIDNYSEGLDKISKMMINIIKEKKIKEVDEKREG